MTTYQRNSNLSYEKEKVIFAFTWMRNKICVLEHLISLHHTHLNMQPYILVAI